MLKNLLERLGLQIIKKLFFKFLVLLMIFLLPILVAYFTTSVKVNAATLNSASFTSKIIRGPSKTPPIFTGETIPLQSLILEGQDVDNFECEDFIRFIEDPNNEATSFTVILPSPPNKGQFIIISNGVGVTSLPIKITDDPIRNGNKTTIKWEFKTRIQGTRVLVTGTVDIDCSESDNENQGVDNANNKKVSTLISLSLSRDASDEAINLFNQIIERENAPGEINERNGKLVTIQTNGVLDQDILFLSELNGTEDAFALAIEKPGLEQETIDFMKGNQNQSTINDLSVTLGLGKPASNIDNIFSSKRFFSLIIATGGPILDDLWEFNEGNSEFIEAFTETEATKESSLFQAAIGFPAGLGLNIESMDLQSFLNTNNNGGNNGGNNGDDDDDNDTNNEDFIATVTPANITVPAGSSVEVTISAENFTQRFPEFDPIVSGSDALSLENVSFFAAFNNATLGSQFKATHNIANTVEDGNTVNFSVILEASSAESFSTLPNQEKFQFIFEKPGEFGPEPFGGTSGETTVTVTP